jgi:uncharacterized small protein (DUF1192 family)
MTDGEERVTTGETAMTPIAEQRFWSRPLVLVLVSIFLSSGISGVVVSFGWKASMDTFSAVSTTEIRHHDERIHALELQDSDRIKASDLALRDQLLDAKLSLLQAEIADLKDQLGLRSGRR